MKKDLICIVCPRGCMMQAEVNGTDVTVTGNACPRGKDYAVAECTNPTRMVTSIVRVSNRKDTMLSVKTETPIPKGNIFDLMAQIRAAEVAAPVTIGQIILQDVYGTNVIATQNVD